MYLRQNSGQDIDTTSNWLCLLARITHTQFSLITRVKFSDHTLNQFVVVFIDVILIYSPSNEEHQEHF